MKDAVFVKLSKGQGAELTLICFHYAGGSANVFRPWCDALPKTIELIAVQLPGRDNRFSEPMHNDINDVLREIRQALPSVINKPYVLFGHSLGALLAHECARMMVSQGYPAPLRLFLSGRRALQEPLRRQMSLLTDKQLVDELRETGGTAGEILDNQDLLNLILPRLRADYQVHESFRYVEREPLDVPISVLAGEVDRATCNSDLGLWQICTKREVSIDIFPGGHFFIDSARERVIEVLLKHLRVSRYADA